MTRKEAADTLRALFQQRERNEHECRKYLHFGMGLLVPHTLSNADYDTEYVNHRGKSDFLVATTVDEGGGVPRKKVYLWELKAPQCAVFVRDKGNRLKPSRDLLDAENKLINYHQALSGDENFRDEYAISRPDDVKLGGVIIGMRPVEGDEASTKLALYSNAYQLRLGFCYDHHGMRLYTWSHVADFIHPTLVEPKTALKPAEIPATRETEVTFTSAE